MIFTKNEIKNWIQLHITSRNLENKRFELIVDIIRGATAQKKNKQF